MGKSAKTGINQLDLSGYTDSQRAAVESTGRDIIVSAGAGTGKTRVLVSRFVRLVLDKSANVDEILTVTFTDKAADEMKHRIAVEFDKLGMQKEKHALETAYISTIHGFCSRVLRENPFAAGIDPEFVVLSDTERPMMLNRAYLELLETADESIAGILDVTGEQGFREGLLAYIELNRSLGRSPERISEVIREPDTFIKNLLEALSRQILKIQNKVISILAPSRKAYIEGEVDGCSSAILAIVNGFNNVKPGPGDLISIHEILKGKTLKDEGLTILRKHLQKNQEILQLDVDAEEKYIERFLISFLKCAKIFWEKYDDLKNNEGSLDYEDLQLMTRKLLLENEGIRNDFRSRFKFVLVDEFQDTNHLQKEIFELLKPINGFFIVGDTRQSIYRFRNADVSIMRGYRDDFKSGAGDCIELNENFRSDKNVLEFINAFFGSLWEGGPENNRLIHMRTEPKGTSETTNIEVLLFDENAVDANGRNVDIGMIREQEATAIAARISGLVRTGYPILDRATEKLRPARYSDIAVLVHTRTAYDYYSKAINEQGIPFSLHQSKGFFDKIEVKDALNFISIIDNSRNDIQVAAVLRSPFFDISDDAYVYIRKYAEKKIAPGKKVKGPYLVDAIRGVITNDILDDDDRTKLEDFISLLDDLKKRRDIVPLVNLFDIMMEKTHYEAKSLTLWGGKRRVENLKKLRKMMDVYSKEGRAGISGFIDFYREVEKWGLKETEAEQETDDADKVKLMTIHGSKGLEFPITILGDLGNTYQFDKRCIIVSQDLEAGFPDETKKNETSLRKSLIKMEDKEGSLEEYKRLFYVAMTRTRDHLILAGSYRNQIDAGTKTPLSLIRDHLLERTGIPEDNVPLETVFGNSRIRIVKNPEYDGEKLVTPRPFMEKVSKLINAGKKVPKTIVDGYRDEVGKAVSESTDFVRRVQEMELPRIPGYLSVSDLMLYRECPRKYYLRKVLGLADDAPDGGEFPEESNRLNITAIELGSLVHGALERIDYSKEIEAEIDRVVGLLQVEERIEEKLKGLLRNFLTSELATEIRGAYDMLREVRISLNVAEVPIQGRIDLMYMTKEGAWRIIDYKSNDITVDEVNEKSECYRLQMELYGLTLANTHNMVPTDATAFFLVPNKQKRFELSPEILIDCLRQVNEIIDSISKGRFGPADMSHCGTCSCHYRYCQHLTGTS